MIFYRLWNNFEDLWILWQLTTYRTLLLTLEHFYRLLNTFTDYWTLLLTLEHFYRLKNTFTDFETFLRTKNTFTCRPRTLLLTMEHFYWLWNTFTDFGTLSLTVEHFANQIFISLCQPLQKRTCVVRVHHR